MRSRHSVRSFRLESQTSSLLLPGRPVQSNDAALLTEFRDSTSIRGFQAGIYKYPARFSPRFVRAAIERFTEPDELILDPFMGGGTTVVEALAAGRRVIGLDVNPLAYLVTRAKTTPLTMEERDAVRKWAGSLRVDHRRRFPLDDRLRGLPRSSAAYLVPAYEAAEEIDHPNAVTAVRAVMLRLGQWVTETHGLDELPTNAWLEHAVLFADNLLTSLDDLVGRAEAFGIRKRDISRRRFIRVLSADNFAAEALPAGWQHGHMILTSPPYPGMHVLYHRWQIASRKETAAPFWLANMKDGAAPSHYTLGGRHERGITTYFQRLDRILGQVSQWTQPGAPFVQVLSFSKPTSQLRRYRESMARAGFELNPAFADTPYRLVPGRRWYAQRQAGGGREYLLVHYRP